MKYSLTERDVEGMLKSMNAPDDFAEKQAIWQRVEHSIDERQPEQKHARIYQKPVRVALIAAAIFVLAATAAAAAGQLVHGRLFVSTTDAITQEGATIQQGAYIRYPGQRPYDAEAQSAALGQTEYTRVNVQTAEAARGILPFRFKAPTWAPQGYVLDEVVLYVGEKGIYDEAAVFFYKLDMPDEDVPPGSLVSFFFDARYVGPGATMEIVATGADDEVRFTEVNGCEAVILPIGGLYWIEDGVAYSLSTEMGVEQAMRMAASMA